MTPRGQYFSLEFMSVMLLIFFAFLFLQDYFHENLSQFENSREVNAIHQRARQTAALLTEFEGTPADWTVENVEVVGLASAKNVLSSEKVLQLAQLVNTDYNAAKDKMRVPEYDFLLGIDSVSDALDISIGITPTDEVVVVSVERVVTYDAQKAVVRLSLFR